MSSVFRLEDVKLQHELVECEALEWIWGNVHVHWPWIFSWKKNFWKEEPIAREKGIEKLLRRVKVVLRVQGYFKIAVGVYSEEPCFRCHLALWAMHALEA